ncbi:hypothetical protein NMY22_g8621 [Coprinellus aureogranulatus]|nr:hypothetical protein NMY22_g8621 [Coprinellus aureogranulatus]
MNDLASVRAEIKSWERTFRGSEGRDPSVDDIRKLPHYRPSKPRAQANLGEDSLGIISSLKSPSRPPSPPPPPSAVVRARKRLRGEHVSPSPSKEKRRRTSSQTTLTFPRLNLAPKKQTLLEDAGHTQEDNEDVFVDDSPVKPSGRKFSLLFDETQPGPKADIFNLKKGSSNSLNQDLFGTRDKSSEPVSRAASSASSQNGDEHPSRPSFHSRLTSPFEELELSPDHPQLDYDLEEESSKSRARSPLLPPTPPASSTTSWAPAKGKRKADSKALSNRKKMKLAAQGGSDEEDGTTDSSDIQAKIKIVNRTQAKRLNVDDADDDLGPDFDPVLDLPRVPRPDQASATTQSGASETVQINLPDKFKDVLDLDPAQWKEHDVEEAKLVKGLIYGRRMASYDPKKGEIWDVGEDEVGDDERECQLTHDDWEGEPVPWEVAEL